MGSSLTVREWMLLHLSLKYKQTKVFPSFIISEGQTINFAFVLAVIVLHLKTARGAAVQGFNPV